MDEHYNEDPMIDKTLRTREAYKDENRKTFLEAVRQVHHAKGWVSISWQRYDVVSSFVAEG